MAEKVTTQELIGFNDLFSGEQVQTKEYYGRLVGKEHLQNIACYFLSFYRSGMPSDRDFLKEWFGHFDNAYYLRILANYNRIEETRGYRIGIFSVESMLRLFTWSLTAPIPDKVVDAVTLDTQVNMLKLYFLFNNDLLVDYQRPADYLDGDGKGRPLADYILAMGFSQSDLINIDYAQLLYCQFYKAIYLLDFLGANQKYWPLLGTFLQAFRCDSVQSYIKAIGAVVFPSFKNKRHGWTILEIPDDENKGKNISFFEQLVIHDESVLEMDDYLKLRNAPMQRISETQFRVIFDLFLVKKVYNGLYFKLRELLLLNGSLFKEDFSGSFKVEFSEGTLVYHILNKIFSAQDHVRITGNEYKAAGIQTEPDFYVRRGDNILLFESKDVYISGPIKLSYDFPRIEAELKKRLYKEELDNGKTKNGAVLQVIKNVKRAINNEFAKLDTNPGKASITIYPVIILHDSVFSAPGLNYLINSWFNEELSKLKNDATYADFDFDRIKPISIVEIDTLILMAEFLKLNVGSFEDLLERFHAHVRLNFKGPFQSTAEIKKYANTCTLPLAEFARTMFNGDDLKPAIKLLIEMLKAYSVPEK
jgi:hypothetical protein